LPEIPLFFPSAETRPFQHFKLISFCSQYSQLVS
jgi:hypothetical protein